MNGKNGRFHILTATIFLLLQLFPTPVGFPVVHAETFHIRGVVPEDVRGNETISILSVSGKTPGSDGIVRITDRTPDIIGTTSIRNADISILLAGEGVTVSASLRSGPDGSWRWTSPSKLKKGTYTLRSTATDPNDPSRTISRTITLVIKEEKSGGDGTGDKKPTETALSPGGSPRVPESIAPGGSTTTPEYDGSPKNTGRLRFTASFPDSAGIFRPNSDVAVKLSFAPGSVPDEGTLSISYEILDRSGIVVVASTRLERTANETIFFPFTMSDDLKPGDYSLRITVRNGTDSSTRTIPFTLEDPIMLHFGGNVIVTASRFENFLGPATLAVILLSFMGIILLLAEYILWAAARRRRISETDLIAHKYIVVRKEVLK